MKKCIAFSAIPGTRAAWIPCVRRAQSGYALCRRHSDVVAGVMLGVCASGLLEDALKKLETKRPEEKLGRRCEKAKNVATRKIRTSNSSKPEDERLLPGRTKNPNAGNFAKAGHRREKKDKR
jgi:hypothetical protein